MNNSTTERPSPLPNVHFIVSLIVINSFGSLFATLSNLLIILTFMRTPSLRKSPGNIFILSLAISDFMVGALVQPLYSTAIFAVMTNNMVLYYSVIVIFSPTAVMLIYASLLTIIAITVDRFLALHLHLRYQELVTTKRSSMVLIAIWTFSASWGFLVVDKGHLTPASNLLLLSLLSINIALMLRISCIIHRHAAQMKVQKQLMKALQPGVPVNIKRSVHVMYYILGTFFACYFPAICFWIIKTFADKSCDFAEHISNTILLLNSTINPIIYFLRIQDMRNAALQMLRFFTRKNNNNDNGNGKK